MGYNSASCAISMSVFMLYSPLFFFSMQAIAKRFEICELYTLYKASATKAGHTKICYYIDARWDQVHIVQAFEITFVPKAPVFIIYITNIINDFVCLIHDNFLPV